MNKLRRLRRIAVFPVVGLLMIAGCGLSNRSDVSTLMADENGALTCALVEPLEDGFTQLELETYIEDQIAALYDLPSAAHDEGETTPEDQGAASQSAGDDEGGTGQEDGAASDSTSGETQTGERRITLDDCTLRDDGIRIVMTYQSWEDYVAFNGMTCFCGTVAEAREAGFDFAPALFDENGDPADEETINERAKEWKVLIFEEAMNVRVPDKILYATDNLKITGRLTASWVAPESTGRKAAGAASKQETDPAKEESADASSAEEADAAQEEKAGASSAEEADAASEEDAVASAPDTDELLSRLAINDYEIAYVIYK